MGKQIDEIPAHTLNAFVSYSWPGNVRELQNLVERAVIRSDDGVLASPLPASHQGAETVIPEDGTFWESERALILKALRAAGGMIGGPGGAAASLGVKRTSLISKMKRLGIYHPRRQRGIDALSQQLSGSGSIADSAWSESVEISQDSKWTAL